MSRTSVGRRMPRWAVAWCLYAAGLGWVAAATAQEADPKTPPVAAVLDEWKTVSARKREIAERLVKLQQDFAQANAEEKQKIREEFTGLLQEFQRELLPKLERLAPQVYRQNPDDVDAAEFVMSQAYEENRFEEAAAIADRLIAARHATDYVVNVAGAAHFSAHDFDKASQILSDAAKQERLDPRLGARFVEPARQYIAFWKQEQEIRAREAEAKDPLPRVLLKTSRGEIELELFENEAPNTVANFISLVEKKTYDGTKFHRVIPNFMAQGGDPNSKDDDLGNDGQGGPGYTIKCECYAENARKHFRGSISMAHAGKDTGGSQFFLTHLPTYWLNPNPDAETGHTVFGRVVKGIEVVSALQRGDEIVSATVLRKRNHEYTPETMPEQ